MAESMSDPQISTIKLQEDTSSVKSCILQIILEKITEGILWIDMDGKINLASASLERILDSPSAQLIGKLFWEVFSDDFFGFSMKESLRYGISHELIYKKNLEISTLFVYQTERGLFIKVSDISEREKVRWKEAQEEQMKILGSLTTRLAHEIRNPLGSIRGFAMLLQRDLARDPALQELATFIVEGTKSLEGLVHSMLEYAKPTKLDIKTQDLTAFLRKLARFIKVDPAFPKKVQLLLHIPDKPILIAFDAEALQRAILNLITNAFQAMEKGGELILSLLELPHACQITVTDTGAGMDEQEKASLFVPFFTTKRKGNGLGLVETKKIIQSHGGSIEVHSQPKKGASFILTIPLRRP